MLKLGVDTGGTFTDFVLQEGRAIRTLKIPSSPDDPGRAIIKGIKALLGGVPPRDLEVIHGSTVATNAFLERKGARTVLITTWGFEDLLFIGRQNRPRLYDFLVKKPAAIIPREQVIGVKERVLFDGTIQKPLGKTVGRRLRRLCRELGAESVAVCLLHSYANDCHERRVRDELASLDIPITLSSEILPEFREYERLCTTLINAYLAPVVSAYIERLSVRLPAIPLFIQQSDGGILPAADIGRRAVHTVLSGPAGGVHGAGHLAGELKIDKLITFDMGGTSTDVALCDNGPVLTRDYHLDGFPVRNQVMDIHTVGAGGGSLVWIDEGGLLRVGPASAGADPGPVCYGRGKILTVTDANLYLGRLLPDYFLGGAMGLAVDGVKERMTELAETLGMAPQEVALGIVRIVNASMAKAVRAVSLERGHEPRDFVLFAFGGASGLHCCDLARELGSKKIVIPARAGILSAQGMVSADYSFEKMRGLFLTGSELTTARLDQAFGHLEQELVAEFSAICPDRDLDKLGELRVTRFLNLRYQGQSYELAVPYQPDFVSRFHRAHEFAFGHRLAGAELELVSVQCKLRLSRPGLVLPRRQPEKSEEAAKPLCRRPVCLADGLHEITVYRRQDLKAGDGLAGPVLVVDNYSTVLLPGDFKLWVDSFLNLAIEPA